MDQLNKSFVGILLVFGLARLASVLLHEWCHLAVAAALLPCPNFKDKLSIFTVTNVVLSALQRKVLIPSLKECCRPEELQHKTRWIQSAVRHSGWLFSTALAFFASWRLFSDDNWTFEFSIPVSLGLSITALDAVASDLLGVGTRKEDGVFYCGNFGLILFTESGRAEALEVLRTMIQVTMIRGAQAGGVVTHLFNENYGGLKGSRSRVVSGKRDDLSSLIISKLKRDLWSRTYTAPLRMSRLPFVPPIFQGHTRFATSSKASLDGTHPHQWSPEVLHTVWSYDHKSFGYIYTLQNSGNYITHNGDFDYWEMSGKIFPREEIVPWLEKVLEHPEPSSVDSSTIAGLMDLLNTQGVWFLSVRFGWVYGASFGSPQLDGQLLTQMSMWNISKMFDREWMRMIEMMPSNFFKSSNSGKGPSRTLKDALDGRCHPKVGVLRMELKLKMRKKLGELREALDYVERKQSDGDKSGKSFMDIAVEPMKDTEDIPMLEAFIDSTVDAFLDNDLLNSIQFFCKNALGSFGLVVSSTISANSQLAMASRGQTMSIAFYPETGYILFGSEQASVKAAMQVTKAANVSQGPTPGEEGSPGDFKVSMESLRKSMDPNAPGRYSVDQHGSVMASVPSICDSLASNGSEGSFRSVLGVPKPAFRIDLDDLTGELALIHWSTKDQKPFIDRMSPVQSCINTTNLGNFAQFNVSVTVKREQQRSFESLLERRVMLQDNPNVLPLPPLRLPDLVEADIADIPRVVSNIQKGQGPGVTENSKTEAHFSQALLERIQERLKEEAQPGHHLERIDLFITGCEVSLWVGEQFAADLRLLIPRLRVRTLSANKVLSHFGQKLSAPQTGFQFSETSFNLQGAVVLILSHSGGTFSSLAVSHLLKGFTPRMFAVCGEGDTQIGRSLSQTKGSSNRIFSTGVGLRPAEPCSVSLVGTHQLLTELLLHLMEFFFQYTDSQFKELIGIMHDLQDIKDFNMVNKTNLIALEDITAVTRLSKPNFSVTNQELKQMGEKWSEHVLEAPISWIISAVYILVTVFIFSPPILAMAQALPVPDGSRSKVERAALAIDSLLYIFLPLWTTILLRLAQGRCWLHRLGTRSLVIGDIPWVSQSLDAFVSKLFACSYSIATINVYSGNPVDHLVHRFTHRVVRGALLAVGRPDGRLSALTTAENSVCLSVNQASSIQNLGATCESITLGHNPFKIPLSHRAIVLPGSRPQFLCEQALDDFSKKNMKNRGGDSSERGSLLGGHVGRTVSGTSNNSDTIRERMGRTSSQLLDRSFSKMRRAPRRHAASQIQTSQQNGPSSSALLAQYATLKRQSTTQRSTLRVHTEGLEFQAEGNNMPISELTVRGGNNFNGAIEEMPMDKTPSVDETWTPTAIQRKKEMSPTAVERSGSSWSKPPSSSWQSANALEFMDLSIPKTQSQRDTAAKTKAQMKRYRRTRQGSVHAGVNKVVGTIGQELKHENPGMSLTELMDKQQTLQCLYEARLASLQRFVAFLVIFHALAARVQRFWPRVSFGFLNYQTSRTHSIMRIATTASPVSGMDVRDQMNEFAKIHNVLFDRQATKRSSMKIMDEDSNE